MASVPDSPRRNPWPVWLAEVMLRPTLWQYGPRAFYCQGRECHGLGGMQRGVAPPFLFHNIATCTCMLSMQHCFALKTRDRVLSRNQLLRRSKCNLLKFSTQTCAEPQSCPCSHSIVYMHAWIDQVPDCHSS